MRTYSEIFTVGEDFNDESVDKAMSEAAGVITPRKVLSFLRAVQSSIHEFPDDDRVLYRGLAFSTGLLLFMEYLKRTGQSIPAYDYILESPEGRGIPETFGTLAISADPEDVLEFLTAGRREALRTGNAVVVAIWNCGVVAVFYSIQAIIEVEKVLVADAATRPTDAEIEFLLEDTE